MSSIEIFGIIFVGAYAVMFLALYVPIAKEDLRRRRAQRHAREFLARIALERKGRTK